MGTRELPGERKVEVAVSWRQVFSMPPPKIDYEPEPETEDGGVVDPLEARKASRAVKRALEDGGVLFTEGSGRGGGGVARLPFGGRQGRGKGGSGSDAGPLWEGVAPGGGKGALVGDAAFEAGALDGSSEPMVLGEAGPAPGESLGGQARHRGIMRAFNPFGSAAEAAAQEEAAQYGEGGGAGGDALFGGDSQGAFQEQEQEHWNGSGEGAAAHAGAGFYGGEQGGAGGDWHGEEGQGESAGPQRQWKRAAAPKSGKHAALRFHGASLEAEALRIQGRAERAERRKQRGGRGEDVGRNGREGELETGHDGRETTADGRAAAKAVWQSERERLRKDYRRKAQQANRARSGPGMFGVQGGRRQSRQGGF